MYLDKTKSAIFQVSEAFGNDLEDVLAAEGIRSTAMIRRRQEVVRPMQIIEQARQTSMLNGIANTVGIGGSLFSIGASIAGIAACNVM